MNEDELELLSRSTGDPWQLAAGVLGAELKLMAVTLGDRGAAYIAAPDFEPAPATWRLRPPLTPSKAARSGKVHADGPPRTGDPTGCGDVWGASFFARLLAGDDLEPAIGHANRLAAKNVQHRGATGLVHHLSGRLSRAPR
jgi:sugar/nucleoside kinase (ribokinase family)